MSTCRCLEAREAFRQESVPYLKRLDASLDQLRQMYVIDYSADATTIARQRAARDAALKEAQDTADNELAGPRARFNGAIAGCSEHGSAA
jgi:hypothetical protein